MARHRRKMEPLETNDLAERAYRAVRADALREGVDFRGEEMPRQVRVLLRLTDYVVRRRLLEHTERESHHSKRGKK